MTKPEQHTREPSFIEKIKMIRQFASDGCTMAPDLVFYDCCVSHDVFYATGEVSRAEADRQLKRCIHSKGHKFLSLIYWLAVRVYGWIPYYFGRPYAIRVEWQKRKLRR